MPMGFEFGATRHMDPARDRPEDFAHLVAEGAVRFDGGDCGSERAMRFVAGSEIDRLGASPVATGCTGGSFARLAGSVRRHSRGSAEAHSRPMQASTTRSACLVAPLLTTSGTLNGVVLE